MTDQPEQHCLRQCVCREYAHNLSISYDPCCVTCEHDTRIRPTPASEDLLKEIASARRGCLTCLNPECPVWQAADQNCWKSQENYDQQVREKVLDELYLLAEDMISDGERMIREEPGGKGYGKGKSTAASVFQMRIESLRKGGA